MKRYLSEWQTLYRVLSDMWKVKNHDRGKVLEIFDNWFFNFGVRKHQEQKSRSFFENLFSWLRTILFALLAQMISWFFRPSIPEILLLRVGKALLLSILLTWCMGLTMRAIKLTKLIKLDSISAISRTSAVILITWILIGFLISALVRI